jgi:hypothetical protein
MRIPASRSGNIASASNGLTYGGGNIVNRGFGGSLMATLDAHIIALDETTETFCGIPHSRISNWVTPPHWRRWS